MLTFFRKIRKALWESGSIRKYLLYAIGEIALVVIGILIALQINNWNEDITREKNTRDHLANLIEAIEMDSAAFDRWLNQQGFRCHGIKYLIELTGNEIRDYNYRYTEFPSNRWSRAWDKPIPDEYNEEFLNAVFGQLSAAPVGIIVNKSAIDEFRMTGLFSAMKNAALKKKILAYYRQADNFYTGAHWDYKLDLSLQVQEVFLNRYNVDLARIENVKDVVDKIKSEKILLSNLHLLLDNVSWTCQTFLFSQRRISELLTDLRAELN